LLGGQNWENTNFFQIGKGCGGYQTSCFPLLYIVTVSPAVWIINQKKGVVFLSPVVLHASKFNRVKIEFFISIKLCNKSG